MLAVAGVHPKTAQQLMRHSDINLTMSRYTHVLRGQERSAIESLPDLDKLPISQKQAKTGTDNRIVDAMGKSIEKSSATYSDSKRSKHSKTLQNIAKQGGTTGQRENPVLGSKNAGFTTKNGALHDWARKDSNLRQMDYESTALTN